MSQAKPTQEEAHVLKPLMLFDRKTLFGYSILAFIAGAGVGIVSGIYVAHEVFSKVYGF